jgi:hypothetical protein
MAPRAPVAGRSIDAAKRPFMLIAAILLASAQAPATVDPITSRIHRLCKTEPRCIQKQRDGMRKFFRTVTLNQAAAATSQSCLARSAKGWLTDWVKAETCLRKNVEKTVASSRRISRR